MNDPGKISVRDDEQLLEDVLRHAEPRPRPSDVARERARMALHTEWQELTATRRRRRRAVVSGIAATLLVAVLAGTQWLAGPTPPAEFLDLDIVRATGSGVQHNTTPYLVADVAASGLRLQHGDELATAIDTRMALAWDHGSLRLDQSTRVRFDDAETLTLLAGTLYYDSTPFDSSGAMAGHIEINTSMGLISHVGTQFQVSVNDDVLKVSVREGEVHVAGKRVDITLVNGEGMELSSDGQFEKHAVDAFDSAWQWAADIAPELQLSGRTTAEVLNWVARETGREVLFASDAARTRAESEPRGIATLAPLPALRTIPYMTSLTYTMNGGYIVVDIATENDQ